MFEFKDLSFSYPGSGVKVLSHVNLTLHAGEHLSVVGLNGAGKTTMVKLLCRLYDPTEGEILMDGVNIKEYDYEEYMCKPIDIMKFDEIIKKLGLVG